MLDICEILSNFVQIKLQNQQYFLALINILPCIWVLLGIKKSPCKLLFYFHTSIFAQNYNFHKMLSEGHIPAQCHRGTGFS